MLISNTSWSYVTHSSLRMLQQMPSVSTSFRSYCWERRSDGSTLTRWSAQAGTSVPMHSSRSSSHQARPVPCGGRSRATSNRLMRQFLKPRLQEDIRACPHHGIEEWLLVQGFYHGLTGVARSQLDVAGGSAFLQ